MHPCPVGPCEEPVPDSKLVCRAHWYMIPPELRTELTRAYHQHIARREDRNRLETLRDVQRRAIAAVEEKLAKTPNAWF